MLNITETDVIIKENQRVELINESQQSKKNYSWLKILVVLSLSGGLLYWFSKKRPKK